MTSRPKSATPIVTSTPKTNVEEKSFELTPDSLKSTTFFESGHGVWRPMQYKDTDSFFAVEIYFRHEKIRLSITISYKEGDLIRVTNIREDSRGFPSKHWSRDIEQVSERTLRGEWQGTSVTLFPDMTISKPVPTGLQWGCWEGNQVYFFPDGITVSCPKKLSNGVSFVFVANWLVTNSKMHQVTVSYDESSSITAQTLDILELPASS